MFVLALVHTFPFIVYNIGQGEMMSEWKGSVTYWTGVAAIIPQAWLTFMSVPWIRNRYYEFFKSTHFVIALLFILFFFFHCDFRLSSWDYFIAAGTLYVFSLCTSWIKTHLINGRHTASLTLLPHNLLRITIPTITSWKPGQHAFLRFTSLKHGLALHSLTSHPFTICSTAHDIKEKGKANEMVFFVKPKHGITGRLAALASRQPGVKVDVLIEGPYGGVETTVLERAENVVIFSGGSGGGFSLGVFEAALNLFKDMCLCGETAGRKVKVVFASHTTDYAGWYRDEIEKIKQSVAGVEGVDVDVDVEIHVTSFSAPSSLKGEDDDDVENTLPTATATATATSASGHAKEVSAEETVEPISSSSSSSSDARPSTEMPSSLPLPFQQGRPDLPAIISASTSSETVQGKSTAIFVCGPTSMLHDVRNAAADAQHGILSKGGRGGEVYLHSESFSW